MGMYSKANILTEVRNILNEPAALFWSDDEINEWIDQAAVDISSKAMCVEASGALTLASGTLEYAEPTDCIKVYAVVYGNRAPVLLPFCRQYRDLSRGGRNGVGGECHGSLFQGDGRYCGGP